MRLLARPAQGWLRSLALLPAALLAILPHLTCPACWPAYAALLSSVGLGLLALDRILTPLLVGALAVGLASVAWSTRSHRQWGPFWATLVGSVGVAAGRLLWTVPALVYGGAAVLIGASLWNLWLKRPRAAPLVSLRIQTERR